MSGRSATKFDNELEPFLVFIISVKIIFALSAVAHVIFAYSPRADPKKDKVMIRIKQQTEFVFIASMSILLMYHFRPGHTVCPDDHVAFLIFLFGVIIFFTADWTSFLGNSQLLTALHRS